MSIDLNRMELVHEEVYAIVAFACAHFEGRIDQIKDVLLYEDNLFEFDNADRVIDSCLQQIGPDARDAYEILGNPFADEVEACQRNYLMLRKCCSDRNSIEASVAAFILTVADMEDTTAIVYKLADDYPHQAADALCELATSRLYDSWLSPGYGCVASKALKALGSMIEPKHFMPLLTLIYDLEDEDSYSDRVEELASALLSIPNVHTLILERLDGRSKFTTVLISLLSRLKISEEISIVCLELLTDSRFFSLPNQSIIYLILCCSMLQKEEHRNKFRQLLECKRIVDISLFDDINFVMKQWYSNI